MFVYFCQIVKNIVMTEISRNIVTFQPQRFPTCDYEFISELVPICMLLLRAVLNSHDIQHRIVPQDFVRDIYAQVQASVCALNTGWIAWPHLQPIKHTRRIMNGLELSWYYIVSCLGRYNSILTPVLPEWLRLLDHSDFDPPTSVQWLSLPLEKKTTTLGHVRSFGHLSIHPNMKVER